MPRSVSFVGHAVLAFILGFGSGSEVSRADDGRFTTDVFTNGAGGYHTYRIPSLLVTPKGTLLAFCEGARPVPPTRATSIS